MRMTLRTSKDKYFKVRAMNLAYSAVEIYQAACEFGAHASAAVAAVPFIKSKQRKLECINLLVDI